MVIVLMVDNFSGHIVVSEYGANRLRKIDLTTNTVTTLFHKPKHPDAGIDDCHQPVGICCVGNEVIVCEYGSHRILYAIPGRSETN